MYTLSTYLPNFSCHFLPLWKIFQFTWTALCAAAHINFVRNLLFSLFIFPFLFSFFREFRASCPVCSGRAHAYNPEDVASILNVFLIIHYSLLPNGLKWTSFWLLHRLTPLLVKAANRQYILIYQGLPPSFIWSQRLRQLVKMQKSTFDCNLSMSNFF